MSDEVSRDIEAEDQAKRDELAQLERADAWMMTLADYTGRQVLFELLEVCGVYRSSFNESSKTMAFNEGKRQIGLFILSQVLTSDANAYNLMRNEAHEREQRRVKLG